MNTAQQIQNAIVKMMFYDLFQNSLSEEERDLIQSIRMAAELEELKMEHEADGGKSVLRWKSSAIGNTVAVYMDSSGFYFSTPRIYKYSMRRMKTLVSEIEDSEKLLAFNKEVAEILRIFRLFSKEAEVYFK